MTNGTIYRELADLKYWAGFDETPDGADVAADGSAPGPLAEASVGHAGDADGGAPTDLVALIAELEAAGATLATASRQDAEARRLATEELARYDALAEACRETERARGRAVEVRAEAERLAASAFAREARAAAERVADLARRAERRAVCVGDGRRAELDAFAAAHDLEPLLAERRRRDDDEQERAAATERAGRLRGLLARAEHALRTGTTEDARTLLDPIETEFPDDPEVRSLAERIGRIALTGQIAAAERALGASYRSYRHRPAEAVEVLAALEVAGLPDPLARRVFGAWSKACARLCRQRELADPRRYAPSPARGVALARTAPDGRYAVVSALGMGASWRPGDVVDERVVRCARRLL